MRKTALVLALTLAVPAWAQDKPAAPQAEKPTAEKSAPQESPQENQKSEAAKAEAPEKRTAKRHSRRMEDARHCLDEPTNTEIIKCAEAYL